MKDSIRPFSGVSLVIFVVTLCSCFCAGRATGQVLVWGNNSYGQTNIPANATNVMALAAGDDHCLALRADGTVVAWGTNGPAPGFQDFTNVIDVACPFNNGGNPAGSYTMLVTNLYGSALSSNAILAIVAVPPAITTQPMNQTVSVGDTATFSVAEHGTSPLSYQWMHDGTIISGATSTMLPLLNVQPTDTGVYTVVISNFCGNVESAPATLTIPVQIVTNPVSQTVSTGAMVSFTVVATGSPTLSYQWYFGTNLLAGATDATLTIASAQPADGGVYTVTVSNAGGSVDSAPVTLAVESGIRYYVATNGLDTWPGTLTQPFKTVQKAFDTVVAGDSIYIRDGTYREQVNLDVDQNHGLPTNQITVSAYSNEVVVIKGSDVVTGVWVRVDGYTNIWRTYWTNNSQQVFVHNSTNFANLDEGYPLQQVGMPNEKYTLSTNTDCDNYVYTNYDWVIGMYTPPNQSAATIVTNVRMPDSTCTCSTDYMVFTSVSQALAYMNTNPGTFFNGGFSHNQYVGTNLYARLKDDGDPNNCGIEASVRGSIVMGYGSHGSYGYYHIKNLHFRHSNGTSAGVFVAPVVSFGNVCIYENCDIQWTDFGGLDGDAQFINCIMSNNGDNGADGSWYYYGCTITNNNYRNFGIYWHAGGIKIIAQNLPPVTVENCNVSDNNGCGIWFDTCTSGNLITIRNNYVANNYQGIDIEVSTNVLIYNNLVVSNYIGIGNSGSSGVKVYNNTVAYTMGVPDPWGIGIGMGADSRRDTFVNNEVKNNIVWNSACWCDMTICPNGMTTNNGVLISVSNNICDYNCFYSTNRAISTNTSSVTGTVTNWPYPVSLQYCSGWWTAITNLSDWTKATGYDSNSLSCDPQFVNGPDGDFRLQPGSPLIDRGQSLPLVPNDYLGIPRPQGTNYDIGAFEGGYAVAPTIVTQPQSQTAVVGQSITFNATVGGCVPLSYQWYFNSGVLTNATNAVLTLTGVTTNQAGIYSVMASNSYGLVLSSNAVLTVNVPPMITPVNVTTNAGGNVTFSVTATGPPPLNCQWQCNGTNLPGATGGCYTLTDVQPNQAGIYSVVVSNVAGTVSSLYAVLRVWTPSGVVAWGDDGYGEIDVPVDLTNAVAIAAGELYSLALKADGTVVGWGYNGDGQTNVPPYLTNVVAIAAGGHHSLALKDDGTVVGWGDDYYGETNVPLELMNVVAIAAGGHHSLALKNDGTMVAWGENYYGETNVPPGLTNMIAIAAGERFSLALRSDGTVVGWGYNGDGQTNVPPDLTNVVAIAAGAYHSLALKGDGTVVGWGYNGDGQTNVPPGLTNVVAVAGGLYHSLVLKGDGTVVAWGGNWDGETNVPPGLTNVVAIAAGVYHSLALGSLPPAIVTPPQSQSVLGGSTAIFSVTATGTQPLGYQWYFNSGVLLTNATGATLTLTNVQPNQAGTYSVTVGNAYGNAAANAALAVQPFVFNAGSANMLMTTNGLQLQLDSVFASQSVVIFASTDLVAWLPILTNPPATGSVLFLDSSATNLPRRFYRASEQ